ncbi:MAG: Gfo/Idh/MocA family oxidoreductase [Candidatus Adiutrix intracellularis]|jgi:predicted dehydrogenase|nr:Gfo/Idh/MocA family oxidoreductase [Candidatus Adiutrix intracellularis]
MVRNKLRLAFLGGGINSAVGIVHRTSIEIDRRFELVAGCFNRTQELNVKSAKEYNISTNRLYKNLDALLSNEKGHIDGIVILTPTDQHAEQIKKCLKLNIPVICEKALVTGLNQAKEINRILKKENGFLTVIYNYTGYPIYRELKYLIKNGSFGDIQQIMAEMPQEGFSKNNQIDQPIVPQDWRLHDIDIPTISLDLGVHLHILVKFLIDRRPVEVVSTSDSYGNFKQVVDNVSGLCRYSGDVNCNYWFTKIALGYRNGLKIRIFGKKMSAEWLQENPEILYLANKKGEKFTIDRASPGVKIASLARYTRFKAGHPAGFIEAFANYYYDIADALEAHLKQSAFKSEYVFGIDETIEGLSLLDAMTRSTKKKEWVKIK